MAGELEDFEGIDLSVDVNVFAVTKAHGLPMFSLSPTSNEPHCAVSDDSWSGTSNSRKMVLNQSQTAKRRRVYRQRERSARAALVHQHRELANELLRLKRDKEVEHAKIVSSREPSYYIWKTIAAREQEERLHVEAENKRLKRLVSTQTEYMKALCETRKLTGDVAATKVDTANS